MAKKNPAANGAAGYAYRFRLSKSGIVSDVVVELRYVDRMLALAQKVFGEVVGQLPEEVLVHRAEAVVLAGQDEHVEALVGLDKGVDHAYRIARVDVVVHVAVHQQQVPFQARGQLGVGRYLVDERGVAVLVDLLLDAVVLLAPPAVVDAVVVVAGARYGRLEEVGVLQDGCRRHETTGSVRRAAVRRPPCL